MEHKAHIKLNAGETLTQALQRIARDSKAKATRDKPTAEIRVRITASGSAFLHRAIGKTAAFLAYVHDYPDAEYSEIARGMGTTRPDIMAIAARQSGLGNIVKRKIK